MSSKTRKQIIGALGEDIACRYLKKKGYAIVERNYTKKWGELDVIAKKGESIRFIEVKSVSCDTVDDVSNKKPEENIHPKKLRRLARTIQTYILDRRINQKVPWQFDSMAVFITIDSKIAHVRILENIPLF